MAPQHASCDIAQQLGSTPVYFLLSSTPDRAARLPRVLATMRRQSLQPAAIVLSIASTYNTTRFVNSSYTIAPELLNQRPRLLVHTVPRDLGPITKYAGVNYLLAHLQPASLARRAIVVVGDDDMFYGSSFIEDYACAVASGPENAVYSVNGRAASNMQKEQRATALDPNLVLRHCFADGSLECHFRLAPVFYSLESIAIAWGDCSRRASWASEALDCALACSRRLATCTCRPSASSPMI